MKLLYIDSGTSMLCHTNRHIGALSYLLKVDNQTALLLNGGKKTEINTGKYPLSYFRMISAIECFLNRSAGN